MIDCDFCYVGKTRWDAKFRHRGGLLGWEFQICDSCRLLLRNVIGPVLHRLTHTQMVEAITAKMDELGISYEDLMKTADGQPMLKPVEQKQIERVVIESD